MATHVHVAILLFTLKFFFAKNVKCYVICLPMKNQGVQKNLFRNASAFQNQDSEKPPSGRLGQVVFPFGQVTFSPSLPNRQGPCRQAIRRLKLIFDNGFEKKR